MRFLFASLVAVSLLSGCKEEPPPPPAPAAPAPKTPIQPSSSEFGLKAQQVATTILPLGAASAASASAGSASAGSASASASAPVKK